MTEFNTPPKCQSNSPVIRHGVQQWHNFAIALQFVKKEYAGHIIRPF